MPYTTRDELTSALNAIHRGVQLGILKEEYAVTLFCIHYVESIPFAPSLKSPLDDTHLDGG